MAKRRSKTDSMDGVEVDGQLVKNCPEGRRRAEASAASENAEASANGLRTEVVPAAVLGLSRNLVVCRATRKSKLIKLEDGSTDAETVCRSRMWDLMIGFGPCGLGCRGCCLMNTVRQMAGTWNHILYDNGEKFWKATRRWLADAGRRPTDVLGLGAHHSDTLLYEGVTGHARHVVPMFANPKTNPQGCKLLLLTKTANVHYLEGLPTDNVIASFSLNPEPIADLWEGKWPDTQERITPSIARRLEACLAAQQMGFETRWRLDPVLFPEGWQDHYRDFVRTAAGMGIRPRQITLGTFRDVNRSLPTWAEKRGLPAMEWLPGGTVREGTHFRPTVEQRLPVYRQVIEYCRQYLPDSNIGLCKETPAVRQQLGLANSCCNCAAMAPTASQRGETPEFVPLSDLTATAVAM